jgi:hypothetical protein
MFESAPGYERRDVNVRVVVWFAIGVFAAVALVFVAIGIFQRTLTRSRPYSERGSRIGAPQHAAGSPALQANPAADLRAMRLAEEATLHSYGWIDRDRGVIRIPIERAIDLTLDRGLPARAVTPPSR